MIIEEIKIIHTSDMTMVYTHIELLTYLIERGADLTIGCTIYCTQYIQQHKQQ